jgi:hypothetical protein
LHHPQSLEKQNGSRRCRRSSQDRRHMPAVCIFSAARRESVVQVVCRMLGISTLFGHRWIFGRFTADDGWIEFTNAAQKEGRHESHGS